MSDLTSTGLADRRVGHVVDAACCGEVSGEWLRHGPIEGVLAAASVLIDAAEAAQLDLAAAGFRQWFRGAEGVPVEVGSWVLAMPTAYDLELVRRGDFSPDSPEQPAELAGTFLDPHPAGWVDQITTSGVAVVVVEGLSGARGVLEPHALREAWCVLAPAVVRHPPADSGE